MRNIFVSDCNEVFIINPLLSRQQQMYGNAHQSYETNSICINLQLTLLLLYTPIYVRDKFDAMLLCELLQNDFQHELSVCLPNFVICLIFM